MKYTTSDLHFGHSNIIRYCNRPWSTIEEMDEALITNWNSVVRPEDEVYELGDFTFHRDPVRIRTILNRLNGTIYHINGNHDVGKHWLAKYPELGSRFAWIKDYFELKENGRHFVMFHFPIASWHKAHHGSIHLHGHEHGNWDKHNVGIRRIDVGTDPQHYFPVTLESIAQKMKNIPLMSVDHHQEM